MVLMYQEGKTKAKRATKILEGRKCAKIQGNWLRPAGSDPEVVCQKDSFLKVSVSLGGFGPSVAHGKHSVRRRCVQATKKQGRNLLSP